MSEKTLEDKIIDWLDTSGRGLELRVARRLLNERAVYQVEQSVTYVDGMSGKDREGDVLGVLHWISGNASVNLDVAIECKSSRAKPWIAFYDERRFVPDTLGAWCITAGDRSPSDSAKIVDGFMSLGGLLTDRVATHAASALGGEDGKNFAADATRQALAFAQARAQVRYSFKGDPPGSSPTKTCIPVVVTQAPLFTCELGDDRQLKLDRVERFDVWLYEGSSRRQRVYVRSESGFDEMLDSLALLRRRMGGV